MKIRRPKKIDMAVNLTPLIDCVFLLLIFFLLTSWLARPEAIEIELPESSYTEKVEENKLVISIFESGEIALNREIVSLDELAARLEFEARGVGARRALLRADKQVRLELLLKVMDEVKKAGLEAVDIEAHPGSRESRKDQ
jgi:biopolymer transport protein ExbD